MTPSHLAAVRAACPETNTMTTTNEILHILAQSTAQAGAAIGAVAMLNFGRTAVDEIPARDAALKVAVEALEFSADMLGSDSVREALESIWDILKGGQA